VIRNPLFTATPRSSVSAISDHSSANYFNDAVENEDNFKSDDLEVVCASTLEKRHPVTRMKSVIIIYFLHEHIVRMFK
jgi:hypothetical protein